MSHTPHPLLASGGVVLVVAGVARVVANITFEVSSLFLSSSKMALRHYVKSYCS